MTMHPDVLKNLFQNLQPYRYSNFRRGLTAILKHGKKKRNRVMLELEAGVAQR